MPDSISPKQAALWFAGKGHPVLALHSVTDAGNCTCGDAACHSPGKHPHAALVPHGLRDATVDLGVIRAWFAEHYWINFGVTTGELLVVDVDVKHNGLATWASICSEPTRPLISTWQCETGSNGRHVMFQNTAKIRNGSLDRGIDLRGVGGYVVGPMCRHASGGTYRWLPQQSPADVQLAEPPDWLLTMIRTRTHCGRPTSIAEWRQIAGTRLMDGERHSVFLRLAGHLISNPLNDPLEIRELLLGWNRGRCDPPLSDADVIMMVENLCERENQKDNWLCPKRTT